MSEIIFDALNPNDACIHPPPRGKQPDTCQVEAKFHVRGDVTPANAHLTFRRQQQQFILETTGKESIIALVQGYGFNPSDPKFQSTLFFSVGLHSWVKKNYFNKSQAWRDQRPWYTDLSEKMRNFIVTGSIENPDAKQKEESIVLLKDVFQLPSKGRRYLLRMLDVILNQNKSITLPSMRTKAQWLNDMLETFERIDRSLWNVQYAPLKTGLNSWLASQVIYLATGEGDWTKLKKELDALALAAFRSDDVPKDLKDLFDFLYDISVSLVSQKFLANRPEAKQRLNEFLLHLKNAAQEGRAVLLSLSDSSQASLAFLRSIEFQIIRAAKFGELIPLVEKENQRVKVSREWFKTSSNHSELALAILPSLRRVGDKGPGRVRVDIEKMKSAVDQLLSAHTIQEREYTVGVLAHLRFLFGKDLSARTIRAWVKNEYLNLPLDLSEDDKRLLSSLMKMLELKTLSSVNRFERSLPWIEGGLCAVGLGIGGAGIGTHQRGLDVGGFTGAGAGCGSLIGNLLVRRGFKKDHWLVDLIGGTVGAGAGFGLSWFFTRGGTRMNPPPPPPPPPPPMPDPRMRNPTGGSGP